MSNAQEGAALIIALASALGALALIGKWLFRLVRVLDRLHKLIEPAAQTVDRELTANSGSSIKDQVEGLTRDGVRRERGIERVGEQVALVREQLHSHSRESRAALAIYRKGLADQGIHLPVAPGEDGPTGNEDTP